jgi:hypothetical protein
MPTKISIDQVYAFVAIDSDGEEGITAYRSAEGWMPLVCGDWDRVQSLMLIAQKIANQTGKTISLVKFERRSQIEEITPEVSE